MSHRDQDDNRQLLPQWRQGRRGFGDERFHLLVELGFKGEFTQTVTSGAPAPNLIIQCLICPSSLGTYDSEGDFSSECHLPRSSVTQFQVRFICDISIQPGYINPPLFLSDVRITAAFRTLTHLKYAIRIVICACTDFRNCRDYPGTALIDRWRRRRCRCPQIPPGAVDSLS